ncbi:uncharacterized protein LOC135844910 [Planococcus citri]|uniref:uncharacterized protein LOC135844910 n=1 Tax=Planococcus citri TaxID=170843 RepID=UPI0031F727E1
MATDQKHERNGPHEKSYEDRYVYLYDVPSLQEIASHEVVRKIWLSNLSTNHPIKEKATNIIRFSEFLGYCDEYGWQQQIKQMINNSNVSRCVETLGNCFENFYEEIKRWVMHLLKMVFRHTCLRGSHEMYGIDPKWCVWSANGKIDYEKSARKILDIGGLTDLHRFLIMCEYCMEDEIKKFSLDLLPLEFVEKVNFNAHCSSFYWICFLKNELHKMPVENPILADHGRWCVEYSDCRFSQKFFWYRLSNDDQVNVVIDWIRNGLRHSLDCTFFKQILSAMSWFQQKQLLSELSEMSDKIIICFATRSRESRIVLWMWKHFKGKMDVEQFPKFFCDAMCNGTPTLTLIEIWETASDHQRNYFILNMSDEFISSYIKGRVSTPGCMENEILRTRRNLMLQKTTQDVVPWHDLYLLNNVGLLLDSRRRTPCSDEQLMLMKLVIDFLRFSTYLKRTFATRNLKTFDNELKAYLLHEDAARLYERLYKPHIPFRGSDEIRLITNLNLWNEFCNFNEEAFGDDVEGALQLKRRLVSPLGFAADDPQCYFNLRRGFDDLVKIVETTYQNDELKRVKRIFSQHFFCAKLIWFFVNFDQKFNSKFELWCDPNSIEEDKSLDQILQMLQDGSAFRRTRNPRNRTIT